MEGCSTVERRRRFRRLAATIAGLAALAALSSATASTPRSTHGTDIGPYRGTATGLTDRFANATYTTPSGQVTNSFRVTGRFVYSFTIMSDGRIVGRGTGSYTSVLWRLDGSYDGVSFSNCMPPVSTTPFTVEVSGRASAGIMFISFDLIGAREVNATHPCSSNFSGLATDTSRLAEGLDLILRDRGGHLRANQVSPSFPPLSKLEQINDPPGADPSIQRVNLYEWNITIQRPPHPPPPGGNDPGPGLGGVNNPRHPRADACTIKGTNRNDVLIGTPRQDVICGFAGHDRIFGRGGNDIIYGGLGNDRIVGGRGNDILRGNRGNDLLLARDGARDRVDGGPGRDTGSLDRRRDIATSVEALT